MSLRLEKNDTSINVGECFIFKYRGNKCLKGKAVFFIYLDKKSRHSVSQYLTSINVWIKESFFYAPAIRRMRKGIKRCPCPSVRPCVLPFVHHLGRYFVSATPPTIFSQSF